ncbi:zinc knuckle transcription factor (CnjB) [Purpureocillium lavendulum]|uniref:Zinc knuckle transcription factor (CnjB) n=1 Tax=Purpureocillium lavendulum TaxID=1247861 RepID=A0AB34FN99_9HYPO|nr:zinc knuckle transcription factor (CnjB) [Purpureocillium lavendulum]
MAEAGIIFYHYTRSPYARRVEWYLLLRGIPYSECLQPLLMPRPDLARLGIGYRRIPVLAIGRDVYLDTRLQLRKLEELPGVAAPTLGASSPEALAVERLLSLLTTDGGTTFAGITSLLPADMPLFQDEAFVKDRMDLLGFELEPEAMRRARPDAMREFAGVLELLETTLLADGRDWILGTPGPGLADIEAVWRLRWIVGIPGALPETHFSPRAYPKAYAWMGRFEAAVAAARARLGAPPRTLSGEEAAQAILASSAPWEEEEEHGDDIGVDADDHVVAAQGLARGDWVAVWPTDTGASGKDRGRLVGMDRDEVVFETEADGGAGRVRVHAPRHGFTVQKVDALAN